MSRLVVVRGGGELGSAAARLLFLAGFPVVVLERAQPLAVRRLVSFSEAVLAGEVMVEDVPGRLVRTEDLAAVRVGFVSVAVDGEGTCLARLRPPVIVDARMAKRNLGTTREQAPLVLALGPGFVAGEDVHAVIETQRGPDLGRVLWSGAAQPDTARPALVEGYSDRRVLRAPRTGTFRAQAHIGDLVIPRQAVGTVDGAPVTSAIAGLLRGLIADGTVVEAQTKLGDVDPRGPSVRPARISDKARAVAAGVMEAVLAGAGPLDFRGA